MLSESLWKKEKSFLQEEASNISTLKKEITKETEIDASVQQSINQKIETLKQNATILAKKVENEKHKNLELETIIRHMKGKIDQERLQEANFRDNCNSENLSSLENKFKKLEYDLGQINGKVNRLSENLEKKRNKISQNRTERVIDSGIFRNIEKELIQSQLTFKKLLIEKIRYQKEYEKKVQEYSSLKAKAEHYVMRKDSTRTKTNRDLPEFTLDETGAVYRRKFNQIQLRRTNTRHTMVRMDESISQQQEKNILRVKKMLIETNLDSCNQLVDYFSNIQEVNDKYFNQINIYADQSNQIEKYLAQAQLYKQQRKTNFCQEKPALTKQQLASIQHKHKREKITQLTKDINNQVQELTTFCNAETFKDFLKSLNIEVPTNFVQEGHLNFDVLTDSLKALDSNVNQFLHQPLKFEEEKNTTARNNGPQKLEELMNKVSKTDECLKVMKKEEFKDEYNKMLKNVTVKTQVTRQANKKKSFPVIKK